MNKSLGNSRFWLFPLLWSLWGLLVVGVYYKRLWRLLSGDSSILIGLLEDRFLSRGFFLWLLLGALIVTAGVILMTDNPLRRWLVRQKKGRLLVALALIAAGVIVGFRPIIVSRFAFFPEALQRGVWGLFGSVQVLLAAFGLGTIVLKAFGNLFEDRWEKLAFSMGTGMGALAFVSLILAALGVYRSLEVLWIVRLLALFGLALSLWRLKSASRVVAVLPGEEAPVARPEQGATAWKIIAAVFACTGLIGALAPEIEYDALWYHLWLPKLWLQAGGPVDLVQEYISLYPMNFELIFGAGLVMGGPIAAKLLHYSCYLLTAMLVHVTVRRFANQGAAWMAVALFMTAPTVLWEATTAYVDVALGFFLLLSVYALLRYAESVNLRWLLLASIMAGLAMGIKHLALLLVGGETLGMLLWGWRRKLGFRKTLGGTVGFLLIAVVLASPWYIRSFAASGNPVFPDLYSVFGARPAERWIPETEKGLAEFKAKFGVERTVLNMGLLPWYVTTQGYRFLAAFGPLFLLFVPALVSRRIWTFASGALLFLVVVFLALWASPLSSFQGRFLVPIVPLIAILAATCFMEMSRIVSHALPRAATVVIVSLVSFLMILNLPPFISLHEGDRNEKTGGLAHVMRSFPAEVVCGAMSAEQYLDWKIGSYSAWQYVNSSLPDSARVLTFSGGDQFYSERERLWTESAQAYPITWGWSGPDERSLLDGLRKLKITHILFDKRRLEKDRAAGLLLAQPHAFEALYKIEFESRHCILCGIR